jgi:putative long chain acyl-CoA synthase
VKEGAPTARRRRQVKWAKRLRRLGLAWDNALEIARAGRLTAPYGAAFATIHEERVYKLRRYERTPGVTQAVAEPLLLVPPLMVASEVYDISPDVSAVAFLIAHGIDVWLVDFGAPEREEGGMDRTLDDHVRAVSDSIDRVRETTGRDVHLCGYSQGGMFCYQTAAFRHARGVASIITAGSPVDLHRHLAVDEDVTVRLMAGLRAAFAWPLARIEGLPGMFTSTGFKLLTPRKEAMQLLDFVRNLHDRQALEKREAKRLFLGGEGFVAWPGPAFRKFVDEVIVGNRLASGGFVVDGATVTLADITCPILYFVGSRDAMGRPNAVRGIQVAAPRVEKMFEIPLSAGHFGLVVGHTAQEVTWPSVVSWMKYVAGSGPLPSNATDVRARKSEPEPDPISDADLDSDPDPDLSDSYPEPHESTFSLLRGLAAKTAHAAADRMEELGEDLGAYLDNARYQLPRLTRLRHLQDDSLVSLSRSLADQAAKIGDRTFFLWRGRAFTYADANRRVDAVARGLIACGVKPGTRVAVMMKSRPSLLSIVTAVNRLGAVSVLLSPDVPDELAPRALEVGEAELLVVDPENAPRARALTGVKLLVLGGVGEPAQSGGPRRALPAGVIDMETIDPAAVTLPAWYRPDSGRARDLAMVFVFANRVEPPRAMRITNRRWAFSALGAAAAATLTNRDTVYCCLPLHHPSGLLVATGSALVAGTRLALASSFDAQTFWDEVRRYGASVVYYAGEMCRRLVDAPLVVGEQNNPVRLFAGSGMRHDVWRRLVDRFGPVAVCELYASTEASVVLANAAGKKVGSVGRPLPGSPDVAIAAWSFSDDELVRDGTGKLVRARLDEPGMLVAKLGGAAGADVAHIDPRRLLRDAFEPGDLWFVTGDLFRVDTRGDYWFVDRHDQVIRTKLGPVPSTRIEDALYEHAVGALCVAVGKRDPDDPTIDVPHAAIVPRSGTAIDIDALNAAARSLPEYARPRRVRVVDSIAMTDGFRPIKRAVRELAFDGGYVWDARAQRYVPEPSDVSTARRASS